MTRPLAPIDRTLLWLGFDSAAPGNGRLTFAGERVPIQTDEIARVLTRPQVTWRGQHLFVHRPIASQFIIHSVRVGNYNVRAGGDPIPADIFAADLENMLAIEEAFRADGGVTIRIAQPADEIRGHLLPLPIAMYGMDVTLEVQNLGPPARFLAGMLGESIDGPR